MPNFGSISLLLLLGYVSCAPLAPSFPELKTQLSTLVAHVTSIRDSTRGLSENFNQLVDDLVLMEKQIPNDRATFTAATSKLRKISQECDKLAENIDSDIKEKLLELGDETRAVASLLNNAAKQFVAFTPAAVEEETTRAVEKTTATAEEETTAAVEEETTRAVEETTAAAEEETTPAAEETTAAAEEETTRAVEETTAAAEEETTRAVEETTAAAEEETTRAVEETTAAAEEEITRAVEKTTAAAEEETIQTSASTSPTETTEVPSTTTIESTITSTLPPSTRIPRSPALEALVKVLRKLFRDIHGSNEDDLQKYVDGYLVSLYESLDDESLTEITKILKNKNTNSVDKDDKEEKQAQKKKLNELLNDHVAYATEAELQFADKDFLKTMYKHVLKGLSSEDLATFIDLYTPTVLTTAVIETTTSVDLTDALQSLKDAHRMILHRRVPEMNQDTWELYERFLQFFYEELDPKNTKEIAEILKNKVSDEKGNREAQIETWNFVELHKTYFANAHCEEDNSFYEWFNIPLTGLSEEQAKRAFKLFKKHSNTISKRAFNC